MTVLALLACPAQPMVADAIRRRRPVCHWRDSAGLPWFKIFDRRLIGAKRKNYDFETAISRRRRNEFLRLSTYLGAQESVEFDLGGFDCARLQETA